MSNAGGGGENWGNACKLLLRPPPVTENLILLPDTRCQKEGPMVKKRWGTFSVKDHKNTRALATDVLLYDRLVFPAPPKRDPKARQWWEHENWAPDLLDRRLVQLGKGLVKTFDWGLEQHGQLKENMLKVTAAFDLANMAAEQRAEVPFHMTRIIIAEKENKLFRNNRDATVVAAFQTKRAFSKEFVLGEMKDRKTRLGYCLGFTLRVPRTGDPEGTLETAIGIARSQKFRRKRRALYEWQDEILAKEQPVKDDLIAFMDLISDYNAEVRTAAAETKKRFACLVGTIAVDAASGLFGNPLAGANGFLAVAAFTATEHRPMVESGPTAMFHHVDRAFESGWRRYASKVGFRL